MQVYLFTITNIIVSFSFKTEYFPIKHLKFITFTAPSICKQWLNLLFLHLKAYADSLEHCFSQHVYFYPGFWEPDQRCLLPGTNTPEPITCYSVVNCAKCAFTTYISFISVFVQFLLFLYFLHYIFLTAFMFCILGCFVCICRYTQFTCMYITDSAFCICRVISCNILGKC